MYQQVYFHRTVRAIDLDLGDVFGPSIRAIFGDGSPADRLAAYADLDEYAPPPGGALGSRARCGRRGVGATSAGRRQAGPADGGCVARDPAAAADVARRGRGARRVRACGPPPDVVAGLGAPEPGRIAIDLARRRPTGRPPDRLLALEGRDGRPMSVRGTRLDPGVLDGRPPPTALALGPRHRAGIVRSGRLRRRAQPRFGRVSGQDEQRVDPAICAPGTFNRFTTSGSIANVPARAG